MWWFSAPPYPQVQVPLGSWIYPTASLEPEFPWNLSSEVTLGLQGLGEGSLAWGKPKWAVRKGYSSSATGGKGAGHNFGKKHLAQGHSISQLGPRGTKMADKTRPWSSVSKWNDTPRSARSKALLEDQGVGGGPNPGNLQPFPK